jgi:23S rRNA (cytosine1962-C5)-methyltransferase
MTMALAKDGHVVTHVDSSKPTIAWAKENAALNGLPPDAVRWIVDDASTFVGREYKRDKRYDAIILDPPAYGHGPSGKAWRVERDLAPLLETCAGLLSDDPAFLILNGYAKNDSPDSLRRLVAGVMGKHLPTRQHAVHAEELMLRTADGRELSTGVTVRCGL